MKIRSVDELNNEIQEDSAWRKKEISFFANQVSSNADGVNRKQLAAATLILYAHWEGHIKNVAAYYLQYLNHQRCRLSDLNLGLLSVALSNKIQKLSNGGEVVFHLDFAHFLRGDWQTERPKFDESLFDTRSNLSWERFDVILKRLGFDNRKYKSKDNEIERLLKWRHALAHGEHIYNRADYSFDAENFLPVMNAILDMMRDFDDDVIDAAEAMREATGR